MDSVVNVCGREIRISGGLLRIARPKGDTYRYFDDPEAIVRGLRSCGKQVDLLTFTQRLPETTPKYAYPMEWHNLAVLPITTFDHWWTEQIGFKARNKAKQAGKKGVIVQEAPFDEALVKGMWEVYNESPIRQGKPNGHYGKDLETVYRMEATFLDASIFIGAFFGEKMIGFAKLVYDETQTQAGLMNIVAMVGHRDKAPANALIAQAVRSCADRGIRYLVYSSFSYGKKVRSSLSDFKERNAFARVDVPRYYVPLTLTGRLALRLGLHHRLVERIPEPVAAKFRELRAAYYQRKFAGSGNGESAPV